MSDRIPLEKIWVEELLQWQANLPTGEVDFPWPGASNITFPLTAMHTEPVCADIMQTLHAPEDYWGVTAKRPDRNEHANPFREFLSAVERNFLKMRGTNERVIQDAVLHGTGIYKNHWIHDRRPKLVDNGLGELDMEMRIHSAPRVEHVPLQHFYIPARSYAIDPDEQGGAQWVAEKFYLRPAQLKLRAKSDGRFLPDYNPESVATISKWLEERADTVDRANREQNQYKPFSDEVIELFEVHVRFDADGDGVEEDLIVIWHQLTGMVLRASLAPFMHGKRPYHKIVYMPKPTSFYGQGMAAKDAWAQVTLTKLLNSNINNVTLTNTAMFAAPYGSSLKPGEPVYPGRVINYQPGEVAPTRIPLGDINQSLPQLQQFLLSISDNQVGMSDLRRGNIDSLPGRTPATTIMSMMQEGNKRFDMVLTNIRNVQGEIGLRLSQNIAQFYMDDPQRWVNFCNEALGPDDAMKVIELLSGGVDEMESSLGVDVSATSAMVNKEAEKQSFIGLLQIITPIYQQAVQTAMMMLQLPPGSPPYETAAASYSGAVQLMERLLEKFDIQNPSQYLGNMKAIAGAMTAQAQGMNPAAMALAPIPMQPYPQQMPIDPTIAPVFGLAA